MKKISVTYKRAFNRQLATSNLIIWITALSMLFQSCQKAVSEQELVEYIKNPKNGVLIEKEVGTVNYKVYYRPSDLLVNQELKTHKVIPDTLIGYYKNKYHKNLYFIVSVNQDNKDVLTNIAGNNQYHGAMVNQLAFGMGQKVLLTTSEKDTLQLLDYAFPRTYGAGQSTNMMFAFENKYLNQAEWVQLVVKDFGLQTGDIRFKFLTKDILKTPNIKFE